MGGLDIAEGAQPPYDLAAADRVREFLEDLGDDLLLDDFETLLECVENQAQQRKDEVEKVAEMLEQERRRAGEWDVIEKGDVDEPWEMV